VSGDTEIGGRQRQQQQQQQHRIHEVRSRRNLYRPNLIGEQAGLMTDSDSDSDSDSDTDGDNNNNSNSASSSRRNWLSHHAHAIIAATATAGIVTSVDMRYAAADTADDSSPPLPTNNNNNNEEMKMASGVVTDKVNVDLAGLLPSGDSAEISKTQRIVFGLFGNDAPTSVGTLKQLFGKDGLPAPCKPLKTDFLIQRSQLEANKIHRSCTENVNSGVNVSYEYSQIWRIIKNERIDFGSVSGKFIAREFPTFSEQKEVTPTSIVEYITSQKIQYLMAVRRGNESGFGFTVFPTTTILKDLQRTGNEKNEDVSDFVQNYIIVGKVCDISNPLIEQINQVSVVNAAKGINYKGMMTGAGDEKNAPDKSCRYGGPMYCNENKPLKKLTLQRTEIESLQAVLYL